MATAPANREVNVKLHQDVTFPKGTIFHEAPVKRVFASKHYNVCIGIGNDHTADLTISEEALKALNAGATIYNSIEITMAEEKAKAEQD